MEIKRLFSDTPLAGTYYHHVCCRASVRQLTAAIGVPSCIVESDDPDEIVEKTTYEWWCELSDGTPFALYDWKEFRTLDYDEQINWHIGAKTKQDAVLALNALHKVLNH